MRARDGVVSQSLSAATTRATEGDNVTGMK
jgi:hypothetical protein